MNTIGGNYMPHYYGQEEDADYCIACQEPIPAKYLYLDTEGYICTECVRNKEMQAYDEYQRTHSKESNQSSTS